MEKHSEMGVIGFDEGLKVGGAQVATRSTLVEGGYHFAKVEPPGHGVGLGHAGKAKRAHLDPVTSSCLGGGRWIQPEGS